MHDETRTLSCKSIDGKIRCTYVIPFNRNQFSECFFLSSRQLRCERENWMVFNICCESKRMERKKQILKRKQGKGLITQVMKIKRKSTKLRLCGGLSMVLFFSAYLFDWELGALAQFIDWWFFYALIFADSHLYCK